MFALILFMVILPPFAYFVGVHVGRHAGAPEAEEPLEPPVCWRRINLACGDGFKHPEADEALAGLRAAGWYIEKQGSERGAFVYLKLLRPENQKV